MRVLNNEQHVHTGHPQTRSRRHLACTWAEFQINKSSAQGPPSRRNFTKLVWPWTLTFDLKMNRCLPYPINNIGKKFMKFYQGVLKLCPRNQISDGKLNSIVHNKIKITHLLPTCNGEPNWAMLRDRSKAPGLQEDGFSWCSPIVAKICQWSNMCREHLMT